MNDNNLYRDIVLLYCPSKVGSTTIATSVRFSACDKYFVLHTHKNFIMQASTENGLMNITTDIILNFKRNVFVIDIYRPSIEKRISEYFETISEHFNNTEENINNYDIEKIIKRFNDIYPHIKHIDYYKEMYNLPLDEINKPFRIVIN